MLDTLNHRQPDRIPLDFGGTTVTGMHIKAVEALRKHYGLEQRPVKLYEPYQCLGLIEDDLAQCLGTDVVSAKGPLNWFGIENKDWKPWRTPWEQDVLIPSGFNLTYGEDAAVYAYAQGDTSFPPSGKMPPSGYFFDAIMRQDPLPDDDQDLKLEDNTEEFSLFSEGTLKAIASSVKAASATGKGVVASFGGSALGDIAMIPAMHMKHPKGIRDITEWYMSTVLREDLLHSIFAYQVDTAIENLSRINALCGSDIDVIFTCGTDFGTQNSTFCSVDTFRSLYAPYYTRLNAWIHANTTWKILKHSCGSVHSFIPDFIKCGFDILNPVQCSATGMDPKWLKKEFGSDLVFWGGGVDTQKTLPFGTPREVKAEVLERCEIFGKGGGFVFNAIHNVQATTPIENIVAMIDAVHEFNGK
ncbi:MAG: methyltransferase [Spirochaetia bacterium]|nr:methyltransferase [Spirochaetia bacterium]